MTPQESYGGLPLVAPGTGFDQRGAVAQGACFDATAEAETKDKDKEEVQ